MPSVKSMAEPVRRRVSFGVLTLLFFLSICVLASHSGLPASWGAGRTATLLAQDPFSTNSGFGGGTTVGWDSWYVEAAIVAVSFLFLTIFCFFVVYQLLLQNYWWPSTAYGVTSALVLVLTVVVAAVLFWEDLHGTGSFTERWWKPGLLGLITSMIASLLCVMFKSSRGRATGR